MLEYSVLIISAILFLITMVFVFKYRHEIRRRKPIEAYHEEMRTSGLNRVLSKWNLTAIGVGAIIGAGIFVMTGIGAREYAGPALAISFVIAGIGCTFAALCYAEFASFLPVEGSAYAYSYATMGEFFAWIIGWDLILEYAMAASAVSVGWSGYLVKLLNLFHIKLPFWLTNDSFTATELLRAAQSSPQQAESLSAHYTSIFMPNVFGFEVAFNLPAFLIVWLVTLILVKGIKEAANTNTIMVILKVFVVLFIIVVGAFFVDTSNWSPFIPEPIKYKGITGSHIAYGITGIISGAAYIFFAYIGFDAVSTQAGEAKNPQKDVPFGIISSLIICTVLYILVSLVLTGMQNYTTIDVNAPISTAFAIHGIKFAVFIISIAAVAGLTSVLIVMLLGQSRVFYAMSKDGLLPTNPFGQLHPKFKTPFKASLLTGFVVSIIAAITPISVIAELVNIGTLLAFVMVCSSVLIMRIKEPNRERPFRTPWVWFVAPMGILFNFGMMLYLGPHNWERLFFWLAIGTTIYFIYSRKHSHFIKKY